MGLEEQAVKELNKMMDNSRKEGTIFSYVVSCCTLITIFLFLFIVPPLYLLLSLFLFLFLLLFLFLRHF